jgi:hypothetical protein
MRRLCLPYPLLDIRRRISPRAHIFPNPHMSSHYNNLLASPRHRGLVESLRYLLRAPQASLMWPITPAVSMTGNLVLSTVQVLGN